MAAENVVAQANDIRNTILQWRPACYGPDMPPTRLPRGEVIPITAVARRVHGDRSSIPLTEKQQTALASLLGGRGIASAALDADVDESVVLAWMSDDPDFDRALSAAQKRRRRLTQLAIETGAEKAVSTLVTVLDSPRTRDDIKVKAASVLLDRARDFVEEVPQSKTDEADPIGAALRRMAVSIPPGASAALGVQRKEK